MRSSWPPFLILLATLFVSSTCAEAATCYGEKYCRACSTCRYCGHCNSGGACGICSQRVRNSLDEDEVRVVQEQLVRLRFYEGETDGLFGPQTKKAVIDFQKAHRLTPDGVVGPRTMDRLERADQERSDRCTRESEQADALLARGRTYQQKGGILVRLRGDSDVWWGRSECGEDWTSESTAFYLSVVEVDEVKARISATYPKALISEERFQCARVETAYRGESVECMPVSVERPGVTAPAGDGGTPSPRTQLP